MKLTIISLAFFIALSQVNSNDPQPLRLGSWASRRYPSSNNLSATIPTTPASSTPPVPAYSRSPSFSSRNPSPSASLPSRNGSFRRNAPTDDSAPSPPPPSATTAPAPSRFNFNFAPVRTPSPATSRSTSSVADASTGRSSYSPSNYAPVPKPQPTPLNTVKHSDQAIAAGSEGSGSFPGHVTANGDNGITVNDKTPDGRNVIIEISGQGIDQKQYDALSKQFQQAIQMVFYEAKYKVALLSRVL